MADTNYISSIVRILETPKQMFLKNNISVTEFRVQLPQLKDTNIIKLIFWGNLSHDVANYYRINDYILVEGYISLNNKQNSKKVKITVLKVYPFLLSYDHSIRRT